MEVYHSPEADLVGRVLRIQWGDRPDIQAYVAAVTTDIQFTATTRTSMAEGNVHPQRLDGWRAVGPLQTLAGARSRDDVVVRLPDVEIQRAGGAPVLRLGALPVQVPARSYGLVTVLGPVGDRPAPAACPGPAPCPSDWFRVRHYNPATARFDGPTTVIRIPQVSSRRDLFQSTVRDLAESPAGAAGWYVYGAETAAGASLGMPPGTFVARAIVPRRVLQLRPDLAPLTAPMALNYINFRNWRHTPARKGTAQAVWLINQPEGTTAAPALPWQVGDRALVMHLFGGIGGDKAEPKTLPGTVTGHFSYGVATVVREPFTGELQWALTYDQVYAHNPNGIISGRMDWAEYMGHLRRGWLGLRPVSDAVVALPALSRTYRIGTAALNPLDQLRQQLAIMTARYRSGDGTGAAVVTPAQSCVQDSSQAMYETIQQLQRQVQATPAIRQWLADHPRHPQTQDFATLVAVGDRLARTLIPLGIVRPDWRANAERLMGIGAAEPEQRSDVVTQLLSWRTIMPRVVYDDVAAIWLGASAQLWVLRTNQVGGTDPAVLPLAPTELFGQYVVIPTLFSRLMESLRWPTTGTVAIALGALVGYGAIALPLGFATQFLRWQSPPLPWGAQGGLVLRLLWMPALLEELGFRVLLMPHPTEGVLPQTAVLWAGLSLVLFVVYHPGLALLLYPPGRPTFWQPTFLALAALLALVCTGVYYATGSLVLITGLHGAVVAVWVLGLGGYGRLQGQSVAETA
jgi:predicted Abi (CAAX) family protease